MAILWLGRFGLFARRFVPAVLAFAVVAACVAAAATTYLRYADAPARPQAAAAGAPLVDVVGSVPTRASAAEPAKPAQ